MIIERLFKNRIINYYIIPTVLLFLWFFLTIQQIFLTDFSFTTLSYNHSVDNFISFKSSELYAGDKVAARFKAQEDYLGIVTVRFLSSSRINNDTVIFRLKEAGSDKWHYQSKTRALHFTTLPFYPFGFPTIIHSKNKEYHFEIESLNGSKNNAIAIDEVEPVIQSKYDFPKEILLSSNQNLISFFIKKTVNAIQYYDLIYSSLIYAFPLLFYILWHIFIKRNIYLPFTARLLTFLDALINFPVLRPLRPFFLYMRSLLKNDLVGLVLLAVTIDLFLITNSFDIVYLIIIGLWVSTVNIYKLKVETSFVMGIVYLNLCLILLLINKPELAEKSAIWAYIFLAIGTIHAFTLNHHSLAET